MECLACCLAERFDFSQLRIWMRDHFESVVFQRDALYARQNEDTRGEIVCLDYGVVVFLAFSSEDVKHLKKELMTFAIAPMKSCEEEEITFGFGDKFQIVKEEILLDEDEWQIKLALSYALGQSVKLEVFEGEVQRMFEQSDAVVANLAKAGKISLSRKDTAKLLGELVLKRTRVHLHCDTLDTPDFFWESSEYQKYYDAALNYLDMNRRLQVLDRRLEAARDTLDILNSQLNHIHDVFLEWIIIILILIEVLFTFIDSSGFYRS